MFPRSLNVYKHLLVSRYLTNPVYPCWFKINILRIYQNFLYFSTSYILDINYIKSYSPLNPNITPRNPFPPLRNYFSAAQVIKQCQSRFVPNVGLIKKTVESLIEKSYVERTEQSADTYCYVA